MTKKYILLDSTGIRRPGQRTMGAETFATYHTIQAAWESDVICLVVDGSQPLSHQDQVVAGICKETKKGLVVIANKADLVGLEGQRKFEREFYRKFNFLKVEKFIWISALETLEGTTHEGSIGMPLESIWESVDEILDRREREIDPEQVRTIFNYLMKQRPPQKMPTRKKAVCYDLLYTSKNPPTFELLVKDKLAVHSSYLRFIENLLRKQFKMDGAGLNVRMREIKKQHIL